MLEAKTKEQREWIKNFVNSLPFFDKTKRTPPCVFCDMVLPYGISIVRKDSVCCGDSVWDEKTIRHTVWIDFDDMAKIIDYLRGQNKEVK